MSTEAGEPKRSKVLETLLLPKEITEFERRYLSRVNKVGLAFFVLHLPVFVVIAYFNDTGPVTALVLTLAALVGPTVSYFAFDNPRNVSLVYGFTSMIMGGLLVHFGQGPVQIEMHFYFFALLAMLAVYANPMVIVVAAVTVALHHLLLWMYLPRSVFNYDAPIWVVGVHALFVVLESVATVSIARSFFDNVIGLEKIVQARTVQLDDRNRAMRLVLDNVEQGFLTINRAGVLSPEHSSIVERWLGEPYAGGSLSEFLAKTDVGFAARFELGWEEVVDGIMPLELTLDQLPRRLDLECCKLSFDYSPILDAQGELREVLVVITDVTAQLERERLEREHRETMHIFDRILKDKAGFLEFFREADGLVECISEQQQPEDLEVLKRQIHTLKGNAMLFGIHTIGDLCHELENRMEEDGDLPPTEQFSQLESRWEQVKNSMETLLGERSSGRIEVDDQEFEDVLRSLVRGAPRDQVAKKIATWKLERTEKRLGRIAEQARGIARRLGKGEIQVEIAHSDLQLDPAKWSSFWSCFVHVVRNAVDHGFEAGSDEARTPTITLTTALSEGEFQIEIADNGRGIDWRAVAEKARSQGLPAETEQDLLEALFRDGVSTRSEASVFSGRGVGMGAVRAECLSRGGRIDVQAAAGQGTRVRFTFPRSSMAEDPMHLYRRAA
ncbi:MAG: ATP-binding protein [Polyangiaceae bacterium]